MQRKRKGKRKANTKAQQVFPRVVGAEKIEQM